MPRFSFSYSAGLTNDHNSHSIMGNDTTKAIHSDVLMCKKNCVASLMFTNSMLNVVADKSVSPVAEAILSNNW